MVKMKRILLIFTAYLFALSGNQLYPLSPFAQEVAQKLEAALTTLKHGQTDFGVLRDAFKSDTSSIENAVKQMFAIAQTIAPIMNDISKALHEPEFSKQPVWKEYEKLRSIAVSDSHYDYSSEKQSQFILQIFTIMTPTQETSHISILDYLYSQINSFDQETLGMNTDDATNKLFKLLFLRNFVSQFIPPILKYIDNGGKAFDFRKDFKTWQQKKFQEFDNKYLELIRAV